LLETRSSFPVSGIAAVLQARFSMEDREFAGISAQRRPRLKSRCSRVCFGPERIAQILVVPGGGIV
jgi:hypothetical protein